MSVSIDVIKSLIERLANTYGFDYETELQKFITEVNIDNDDSEQVIEKPLVDPNKTMKTVMSILNNARRTLPVVEECKKSKPEKKSKKTSDKKTDSPSRHIHFDI